MKLTANQINKRREYVNQQPKQVQKELNPRIGDRGFWEFAHHSPLATIKAITNK